MVADQLADGLGAAALEGHNNHATKGIGCGHARKMAFRVSFVNAADFG